MRCYLEQARQPSGRIGVRAKEVFFFMDLAEFETRSLADRQELLARMEPITRQCQTLLSFNLKEAWQMGELFGGDYSGRKDADAVASLAAFLRSRIAVDRVIIHPNERRRLRQLRPARFIFRVRIAASRSSQRERATILVPAVSLPR